MSNLTSTINVQIDKEDKEDKERATKILQKLGVSMSGLINMTIKQLIMRGGIPFEVSSPQEELSPCQYFSKDELENTARELNYIENHPNEYKSYVNMEDLKKDLLSDD